jgi:hypothetical protein
MAFFDDFAMAVSNYPKDNVTLEIVNVVVAAGTPGVVNVNEIWQFQVRVHNNGHLNLTNVMLHIEGQNGATVGQWNLFGTSYSAETFLDVPGINAHSTLDSAGLLFKAPTSPKPLGTVLVTAHISDIRRFTVNLDHILNGHGVHAVPAVKPFIAQVFP